MKSYKIILLISILIHLSNCAPKANYNNPSDGLNGILINLIPLFRKGFDKVPPVAGGNGAIQVVKTSSSLVLNWELGNDNFDLREDVLYSVYKSNDANLNNVTEIKKFGELLISKKNINTFKIESLPENQTAYYNILISDQSGNEAAYTMIVGSTSESVPPKFQNGDIWDEQVTFSPIFTDPTSSMVGIYWTRASDNVSSVSGMTYKIYRSSDGSVMNTVSDIEKNGLFLGKILGSDVDQFNLKNHYLDKTVSPSTDYYYNVIVSDESNNKTAYKKLFARTPKSSGNANYIYISRYYETVKTVFGYSGSVPYPYDRKNFDMACKFRFYFAGINAAKNARAIISFSAYDNIKLLQDNFAIPLSLPVLFLQDNNASYSVAPNWQNLIIENLSSPLSNGSDHLWLSQSNGDGSFSSRCNSANDNVRLGRIYTVLGLNKFLLEYSNLSCSSLNYYILCVSWW